MKLLESFNYPCMQTNLKITGDDYKESNQIYFDHIFSYPSEPMAGASQVKSPISEKLSNQIFNFLLRDETKNPNKAWEPKKNHKTDKISDLGLNPCVRTHHCWIFNQKSGKFGKILFRVYASCLENEK